MELKTLEQWHDEVDRRIYGIDALPLSEGYDVGPGETFDEALDRADQSETEGFVDPLLGTDCYQESPQDWQLPKSARDDIIYPEHPYFDIDDQLAAEARQVAGCLVAGLAVTGVVIVGTAIGAVAYSAKKIRQLSPS